MLRPDQTDTLARSSAAWRTDRRVLVQAPCGYGKTHLIAESARRAAAKGKRVVIVAHRRRLIDQISDRLELFGVRHNVVMATPTDKLKDRADRSSPVQVCSKDTLVSRAIRHDWTGLPVADLLIVDEAHNLLGEGYANLAGNYSDAYWLGLTATPVTGDGRGLGGFFGELVVAMPVSECIARGITVPFRVYGAFELKDARLSGQSVKPAGDPVQQWRRHAGGRPTVLFAPSRALSREYVNAFNAAGVPAVHIDAHSPEADRDAAADGLESGSLKVVSQVGLWTEGVDVPCLSVCQLLCRCGSLVKWVQAVSRAGRAYPGKEFATVIDHTGAVFEHGFPDEDIDWRLADGDPKKAGAAGGDGEPSADREPLVCTRCGLAYAGTAVCPACGSGLAVNKKMYQPDLFAHLVEIDRDGEKAATAEGPQRHWTRLCYQFARTGKTVKALVAAFKARCGCWPSEAGVTPVPDRGDFDAPVADVWPYLIGRGKEPARAGAGLFTAEDE